MKPLSELANEINSLRRGAKSSTGNYNKILEIFYNQIKSHYSKDELKKKPQLISDILMSFYKLKKFDKGVEFIENSKFDIFLLDEFTIRMYGWCVYQLINDKFKNIENWEEDDIEQTNELIDNSTENDLLNYYKKIKSIFDILPIDKNKQDNYLVTTKLLFAFLKVLPKNSKVLWQYGFELLNIYPANSFSEKVKKGEYKGKEKEYASDFEKWHALKSKALFELGKYEECINFTNDALEKKVFNHHDYNIWAKRRMALSYYYLEKYNEALSIMKEVIKEKKEWYIQKEIAEIFFKLNRYEEALKYAIDAILNKKNKLIFKWKVFYLIYEILLKMDDLENALLHLKFSASIRKEEGWKQGEKITESLKKHNIEIENLDHASLKKEINTYANSKLNIGEIKNIIHYSKLGFINSKEGDIFFRFNVVEGNPNELKKGDKVYFSSDISFDKRKNRESVAAIYVSKITE